MDKPKTPAEAEENLKKKRHAKEENEEEKKKEREETKMVDLPPELFPHILQKIPDIGEFFRCRAVCKPWHFSTRLSDLGPQFPLLLKFHKGKHSVTHLEFYSVALNKVYTIPAPICSNKMLFGHAGGYMLAGQVVNRTTTTKFSLVNPLNNTEVPLPDFRLVYYMSKVQWICPPSFQCDDYVILLISDGIWERLAVCKPGDDRWNMIGPMIRKRFFYLKGLLFMVDLRTGVTEVMHTGSRKELYEVPPPLKKTRRSGFAMELLVESCRDILGVCRNSSYKMAEFLFDIYRLELGNGEGHPCWVKVRSIGDRILFLDFHAGHGFSLSANDFGTNFIRGYIRHTCRSFRSCDFAAFRGNSIFFTRFVGKKDGRVRKPGYAHVINMYDIEKDQTFYINSPFNHHNFVTWFLPRFDSTISSINVSTALVNRT